MDRPQRLTRVFASAVVRRLAVLLVAAALAWLGFGEAWAQDTSGCANTGLLTASCPDQGTAHAGASAAVRGRGNYTMFRDDICGTSTCTVRWSWCPQPGCSTGYQGTATRTYPKASRCDARSDVTSTFNPKSGSISCVNGCEMAWFRNADSTSTASALGPTCNNQDFPTTCTGNYYWNPLLNVCEPSIAECESGTTLNERGECAPETCPAGMVMGADGTCGEKKNECPAGNVKAPSGECLPGDGQCAAGEARRPNGTCGKDVDGDGQADDDDEDPDNDSEKSEASGGDTCTAPPTCSGDAIACMQVKIQWRIDCNTRKNRNVSGGSCSAVPVCSGESCDAVEYASLLQQWKAACALEKLAGTGLGGDEGQPAWTRVDGMGQNPGAGESADDLDVWRDTEMSTDDLDTGGFGGGAGCPALVSAGASGRLSGSFAAQLASPPAVWCEYIGSVYAIMLVFGAVASCVILASMGRA